MILQRKKEIVWVYKTFTEVLLTYIEITSTYASSHFNVPFFVTSSVCIELMPGCKAYAKQNLISLQPLKWVLHDVYQPNIDKESIY